MFIFDRCPCSIAADTPVKNEHDSKDVTDTFSQNNKCPFGITLSRDFSMPSTLVIYRPESHEAVIGELMKIGIMS